MKSSVLTRYRVMAYVTAVLLILLCLAMIAEYGFHVHGGSAAVGVTGFLHGWLYVVYLVFAFDLCAKAKWPLGKMALVLLAGTIPTAAIFVERRVTRELASRVIRKGDAATESDEREIVEA
jgi:integral membrane protein